MTLSALSKSLILSTVFAVASFAGADMKIVSKISVETPAGPKLVTVVTFIKGSMMRIDQGDKKKLSDSRTHKTIMFDTTKRIYYIPDSGQMVKDAAASVKKQRMKIEAVIKPTGKKMTIAGRTAQQYVGDLTITGDFPSKPGSTAVAKLHIDQWTTQASGISVSQSDMMGTVGDLLRSLASVGEMKKVTTELAKIKGIPLTSTVTGNVTVFSPGGGAPQSKNQFFKTEATTVTEGPLPASVFQIPAGYTQVDSKGKPVQKGAAKPAAKTKK